jgi:diguanylate cyclase (GGDEF)-like protein
MQYGPNSEGITMKQQILVIDDSKQIHSLIAGILADESVEIQYAFEGKYGLILASSVRPDVILLDVEMPGMDGYETCKRLKADPALFNIPVIFLTALSTTEEKVKGLELGAADYVTKPFSPSELLARVRVSLRTHRAILMLESHALVDFLTGLGNSAMFKSRLAAEVSLRVRTHKALACIVVDVDNFQAINDTQGHPFADRLLQSIAGVITKSIRVEDVACRLGGDAFVILNPNTETNDACLLASRIETALGKMQLNNRGLPVEVKCSVAVAPSIDVYDRNMFERANEAIDEAKKLGRTGVVVAGAEVLTEAVA